MKLSGITGDERELHLEIGRRAVASALSAMARLVDDDIKRVSREGIPVLPEHVRVARQYADLCSQVAWAIRYQQVSNLRTPEECSVFDVVNKAIAESLR